MPEKSLNWVLFIKKQLAKIQAGDILPDFIRLRSQKINDVERQDFRPSPQTIEAVISTLKRENFVREFFN